jgi:hypothetical protein
MQGRKKMKNALMSFAAIFWSFSARSQDEGKAQKLF